MIELIWAVLDVWGLVALVCLGFCWEILRLLLLRMLTDFLSALLIIDILLVAVFKSSKEKISSIRLSAWCWWLVLLRQTLDVFLLPSIMFCYTQFIIISTHYLYKYLRCILRLVINIYNSFYSLNSKIKTYVHLSRNIFISLISAV